VPRQPLLQKPMKYSALAPTVMMSAMGETATEARRGSKALTMFAVNGAVAMLVTMLSRIESMT
jgi:hypothetical protein